MLRHAISRGVRRGWGVIPPLLVVAILALRACVVPPPLSRLTKQASEPNDPAGATVYTGSLYIARAGPVLLGFHSSAPAKLTIISTPSLSGDSAVATREIIGAGVVKDRMILAAGPVSIRFAAPASARLMWSPVGRRGDLEYVPSSSLSPDPPDRAEFSTWVGASPLDGVFAAALLVIVVVTLLAFARNRLAAVPSATWIAMAAAFAVACTVRCIDLGGQGQTWDEDVNWSAGRNYVTNVLDLEFSADAWQWNYEHPPIMKLLAGIGAQFADGFGPARALSAVWMSLAIALLVPIGARLFSRQVGWLAAGIAAGLPPLVAHGQIVGHESPSLLWWMLAMLLALTAHDRPIHLRVTDSGQPPRRAISRGDTQFPSSEREGQWTVDPRRPWTADPRVLWTRLISIGIVIGIATASRFINGLVGPLCVAILAVTAPSGHGWRVTWRALVVLPLVAAATLYAVWPRLWLHPWNALSASLAKLTVSHPSEPFLGAMTAHPGPHYFVAYLAATLPAGIALGVLAYVVRAIRKPDALSTAMLAMWFAAPLLVALSPVRQDGIRYVLPSIAGLALAAAAGFDYLATRWRHAFPTLAAGIAIYLSATLARIHPYYLDYFGEQVGGAGTIARRGWFETAWWGEGLDRAVDYVNAQAGAGTRVFRGCIAPLHLAWFRGDLWPTMANAIDGADWVVAYAPMTQHCPILATMTKVFSVDADGSPLAEVWRHVPDHDAAD